MKSAQQLCTFFVDELCFGIEVEKVQEVIRYQSMTGVPLAPVTIGGLINLRGQIVTAIDLRKLLELPDRAAGQLPMNVVIKSDDGAVSLLVDEIGDVVEVDDATFEFPPDTLRGNARTFINGVFKLKHCLLLLLNTDRAIN